MSDAWNNSRAAVNRGDPVKPRTIKQRSAANFRLLKVDKPQHVTKEYLPPSPFETPTMRSDLEKRLAQPPKNPTPAVPVKADSFPDDPPEGIGNGQPREHGKRIV